jgi:hypothetical protein
MRLSNWVTRAGKWFQRSGALAKRAGHREANIYDQLLLCIWLEHDYQLALLNWDCPCGNCLPVNQEYADYGSFQDYGWIN